MPETGPPERIDLGALPAASGFFLPRDAAQAPFVHESGIGRWRFCATFRNSETTLRDSVLNLIRNAQHKVFVTSFILGDDELTKELQAAADRLTGGVYVISELSELSLRRGLERLAEASVKGDEIGSKVELEKKRFMSLTRHGVAVRGHEDCHAKFVVVDDAKAWVGSANLETRAFTEVGEVGVVITDPSEVDRLARLFARMWLSGCRWELPSTSDYSLRDRDGDPDRAPVAFTVPTPSPGPGPSLVWTDRTDQSLLTAVHAVISEAKRSLLLASFTLDGMVDRPDLLLKPVAEAAGRGVEITMLVRTHNGRDRHRRDAAALHELGVRLLADRFNHAKAAVADETKGALFSANFDARHGLDAGSGIEIGARLDGTPALADLVLYLRHALAAADYEFVPEPIQRQLNDRRVLRKTQIWPLPVELSVRTKPASWRELARAAEHAPALWIHRKGEPVELLVGRGSWPLRKERDGRYRLADRRDTSQPAADLLKQWERKPPFDTAHGYCPAVLAYSEA